MSEIPNWIDIVTIICIILCFLIIGLQIYHHLRNFNIPVFQSKIMLILLMPPIYVLLSSLSIWVNDTYGYILLVRDIYESIVIYAFFKLLTAYIGYDPTTGHVSFRKVCEILGSKGPHPHTIPFNLCLKPMNLVSVAQARKVFRTCKIGVLQYIPVKLVLAILLFIAMYVSGQGMLYDACGAIAFAAVALALYWLVFFFHIFQVELKPYKPLLKFITVKAVLFLTFWQEQILAYFKVSLTHSRYVPPSDRSNADGVLSCLLVDIEMVIMSITTAIAFSYKDFVLAEKTKVAFSSVLKANIHEMWRDMSHATGLKKVETFAERPEDHILITPKTHHNGMITKETPEENIELNQISSNLDLSPNTAAGDLKNLTLTIPDQGSSRKTSTVKELEEENLASKEIEMVWLQDDTEIQVEVEETQKPQDPPSPKFKETESLRLGKVSEEIVAANRISKPKYEIAVGE